MKAYAQQIIGDNAVRPVGETSFEVASSHVGDLSLFSLFWQADIVVKLVIVLLLLISIYGWVIIIEKYRLMKRLNKRAVRFRKLLIEAQNWQSLYEKIGKPRDPLSAVFVALSEETLRQQKTAREKEFSTEQSLMDTIIHPLNHITEVTVKRQSELLETGLGFLATTASAAPFIGLFGTVWGIMNSFSSIAASNQTSLAVVAPGIAEALFATALGLVAAIPASIAFNKFNEQIARYMSDVENFAYEFSLSLKKQTQDME